MNCPNCGAETNGSVCPVCGAEVGTSGGFTLAGNDQPQQPENAAYGAQPQQGMGMAPQYGGSQYQGDPMQNGYAGNAYGKYITIRFLEFERPETRFDSLKELKACVMQDMRYGEEYLREHPLTKS